MVARQEPTSFSPEQKPLSVHKTDEVSVAPVEAGEAAAVVKVGLLYSQFLLTNS